ncbi:tetratricopeptide repeat protein [Bradyrhizobium sp.]|uniref:tetratricopeptide repeat protein n=1 Tax=Bradyrhizobium sp. TaxID=376 RepID=UPI00260E412B|nr:tetratricopeptide repeat protein [Bradyrhizobium sp.]
MNRRERRAKKSKFEQSKTDAAAQCQVGHRLLQAGQSLEAQLCCQKLLAADPDHVPALHLMGLIAFAATQHDHALEWIARAIAHDPRADYLASLGTTLSRQGRHEEALRAFDKAVQLKPDDAALWKAMGDALLELKRYDHALLSFQHALKLDPRNQDAAYKSGVLLHDAGRNEEAVTCLDICDQSLPNHAPTLQARARALLALRKFDSALSDNLRANTLVPENADTHNNIGACLQSLGREEEARAWFDRALERLPDSIEILNNKANILQQLQCFDEALALYENIRARHLNNATTDWNLSLLNMLLGDFEAGWSGREARWKIPDPAPYPKFSQPMWLGKESIAGKTLLVHVDEGLGDTIQFVRYVPDVAALGARVILAVERPLVSLLSGFPGVSQCLAFSDPLPAFDMHCPIGSLPLAFNTRLDGIPADRSYLPPPREEHVQAWDARLGPHERLRVGLVWSGSRTHRNDHNRSMSLQTLSRILDVDAVFVSLQKDVRESDKADLATSNILDWTTELTDFADTAALVKCLDLVISVDTSVAHLAAALGCPTWVLLPWTPDYRWLLNRDDSPWYPTVRLFRQNETRDYRGVLDQVRSELFKLAAGKTVS